jgi:Fur family ferric uptake transcriptional regulator
MKSHKHPKASLQDAVEVLELSAHRLTKPRQILLKMIFAQKAPFSAPKLMKSLARKGTCDLVTVYRTLAIFEEIGIIEKCDFSDDMANYEVALGHHGHHHHHVVCTNCKKVEPLDFCLVKEQENSLKKLGYTDLNHRLEFSGKCPACS